MCMAASGVGPYFAFEKYIYIHSWNCVLTNENDFSIYDVVVTSVLEW